MDSGSLQSGGTQMSAEQAQAVPANPTNSPVARSSLFRCDVCGKDFQSLKSCRKHKSGVHGQRNYACSVEKCSYSTNVPSKLQRHMHTHTGEKPFACDVADCDKAFVERSALQRHTRDVHELSRPFLCQQCAYSFTNAVCLRRHVKAVHDKAKDWRCEVCFKQFSQKGDLTRHTAMAHEEQSRFRCERCDKGFYRRTCLERHALTHLEEAEFKCDVCERQFFCQRNLAAHVRRIHGRAPRPKNHKCGHCEYVAADKTRLERHVSARHVKDRPFRCADCSKSFAHKWNLQNHVHSHGAQIFECARCERKYRSKDGLRHHMKRHGESLRCAFCKYATPRMPDLKRHVLAKHKDGLRQTIVAAHSEAPCCRPDGEVTASKGDVWVKYERAPGTIGQGDFGSVFKAKLHSTQDTAHGYRYAVKSVDLMTTLYEPVVHLRKCRREARLMHDCRHDNVIPIYEFFEDYYMKVPRTFYMVMELGSESLTSVKDNNHLTEIQCLFIFAKVAAALKHVHSLGIVHGDVKPDNIMICFDGVPKLGDFGESERLQDDGTCVGTRGSPMYMAPEMVTTPYGPKADVFSFGISAAEVTCQQEFNLIRTNEVNTRKALCARVSHMSAAYQELVLNCVAFDPSKRPSSCDVFDTIENGLAQGLDASCMQNVVENFIY